MANPALRVIHGASLGGSVDPRICAESHGVFRLRRLIEPPLAARACRMHTPDSLDRIEALIVRFHGRPVSADDAYQAQYEFLRDLIAPAANDWDLRTIGPLWWEFGQRVRHAMNLLAGQPLEFMLEDIHRPLVTAYRIGDPVEASAATQCHIDLCESATMRLFALASQVRTSPPSVGTGA